MAEEHRPESEIPISLYTQMFALSGAMVGVCLTVIGVFRLIAEVKNLRTLGDDLVAVDGLCFLLACVSCFITLKASNPRRRRLFQRLTDTFFMIGITLMMVVCAVITWAFTHIHDAG